MIVINSVDNERFSINGIYYQRIFIGVASGLNNVIIKNIYDSKMELSNDNYSNYIVNGIIYANQTLLLNALSSVLYRVNAKISGKNLLINAGFRINQRGYVDNTPTTSINQYTFDRWKIISAIGGSVRIDNSMPGSFLTAIIPNGVLLNQTIYYTDIPTGVYTLYWEGTASATITINGIVTPIVKGGTISWTYNQAAVLLVNFTNGTLRKPQLEAGTTPTDFEYTDQTNDFIRCAKYFYKDPCTYGNAGWSYVTSFLDFPITVTVRFPTPMFTIPTVNLTSLIYDSNGVSYSPNINVLTNQGLYYGIAKVGTGNNKYGLRINAGATYDAEL